MAEQAAPHSGKLQVTLEITLFLVLNFQLTWLNSPESSFLLIGS